MYTAHIRRGELAVDGANLMFLPKAWNLSIVGSLCGAWFRYRDAILSKKDLVQKTCKGRKLNEEELER
jgi:hypothetical protein